MCVSFAVDMPGGKETQEAVIIGVGGHNKEWPHCSSVMQFLYFSFFFFDYFSLASTTGLWLVF